MVQVDKVKKDIGESNTFALQAVSDAQKEEYDDFDDYLEMVIQVHLRAHTATWARNMGQCTASCSAATFTSNSNGTVPKIHQQFECSGSILLLQSTCTHAHGRVLVYDHCPC